IPSPSTTQASAGTGTFSPTASIKPWRTITVPLAITGPLTVTILALRIATVEGASANAQAQNRSSAVTSFFIKAECVLYTPQQGRVKGIWRCCEGTGYRLGRAGGLAAGDRRHKGRRAGHWPFLYSLAAVGGTGVSACQTAESRPATPSARRNRLSHPTQHD